MEQNNIFLFALPTELIFEVIKKVKNVNTLAKMAATCSFMQGLIRKSHFNRPIMNDASLIVREKNNNVFGTFITQKNPFIYKKVFDGRENYNEMCRFDTVRIKQLNSEKMIKYLKPQAEYCNLLSLEMEDFCSNVELIYMLINTLKPRTTKVNLSRHTLFSFRLEWSIRNSRNVEINVSDIQRITNDFRNFIHYHELVVIKVRFISENMMRRMFRRWDVNEERHTFGVLKKLEVHITDPNFIYSPKYLMHHRTVRFLGGPPGSGGAVLLGKDRKALVIFEPWRIVFIPLSFLNEELLLLATEYCPLIPVDISALLTHEEPFTRLLELKNIVSFTEWD